VLESAAEPPVVVVDLLMEHKAGILTMLRGPASAPPPIIAPTDIIGSATINVIGSAFGDIIGPLTPKNRTACKLTAQRRVAERRTQARHRRAHPVGTNGR
jgi:hypothetical protein